MHHPVDVPGAPKPVGPYVPAMTLGNLVFVSGQGARRPDTGELSGPDIESQTEQVLRNVAIILEAAGSNLQQVVRTNVYLTDMAEFSRMNAVYERMFSPHKPARTTIQAAALPIEGLKVEIDCIAWTAAAG